MAEISFVGACSHSGLMVRMAHCVDERQRARIFEKYSGFAVALSDTKPDALVIVGTDHFNTFQLSNMPTFCIGLGEGTTTWGDAGVPGYDVPFHTALAQHLANHVVGAGMDVSTGHNMRLDHAFACPLHFLTPKMEIPIVPVFVNCTVGPLPSLRRAHQLGAEVRRAIETFQGAERVAVLGTGGLSHSVPLPDIQNPKDAYDRHLVEALWVEDRDLMKELVKQRIDQWATEERTIGEEFDASVLAAFEMGEVSKLLDLRSEWIFEKGGNGGQEIRTWLAASGAAADLTGDTLLYEPVSSWLTGIGIFRWHV